ncbi:MFS transporter [Streptomyces sp. Ru73]|uniref:MFS transporter n=1 Tax=Streptomyces sp. Ru73 TaxID=2080748 RepID=UPI000CDD1B25|nr:MFS transporter [Streptomyces sp. Ru73]POX43506.1 MFS transporter [Streptomyces sp. Ru73]
MEETVHTTRPAHPRPEQEAVPERPTRRGWAAVGAVAAATFTVVTSEMLPVGLLTPMGRSLGVSEGAAGLALTVTGLVAAASAPLLTPLLGRRDRRAVLCALMLLLTAGNLLAAWAPHFGVLMAGRVLVGVGMGGVWTVAASLAARLVPGRPAGAATSLIFSGIAVASVLGVPAGTYLGEAAGWRTAFIAVGALGAAVAVALAVLLPRLPVARAARLGGLFRLAGERTVRIGLLAIALLVTGHFTAYTYVRPVLEDVSGAGPGLIGALLLAYGIAGVVGNFAGAAGAARSPRRALLVISAVLAAAVLLVPELGGSPPAGGALLVVWGLAYGGVSVAAQTWLQAAVPHAREAAAALFVGVFNASIALGAAVGGRVADGAGLAAVLWTGGALAAGALVVVAVARSEPEAGAAGEADEG